MEVVICIFVMVFVIVLGSYAIAEGQRIESQKKFMKNMDKFDTNKTKNEKK